VISKKSFKRIVAQLFLIRKLLRSKYEHIKLNKTVQVIIKPNAHRNKRQESC
jgi:hypothetical protein